MVAGSFLLAATPISQQTDEEILTTICIGTILAIVFLWIWPAIWMYRDAKRRGREQTMWLLIGLLAPGIGPIVWFIVRDDPDKRLSPPPYQYGYPPPQYYQQPSYYQGQDPYVYYQGSSYPGTDFDLNDGYNQPRYGRR